MHYDIIDFKTNSIPQSELVKLSVFEGNKDIPFEIKRFFYTHGAKVGTVRGGHAYKKTVQLLFCVKGKIEIVLDDGTEKMSVVLDKPETGLIVYPEIWHNMVWQEDNSILCVAASELYNSEDYLRSYDGFLNYYGIKR